MPDPERVAVVTGATAGIGIYTALGLALQGMRVITVGRDPARTERARRLVAERSGSDRIGTALADDPLLTCRLPGMENRSPLRIVLDPELRLPTKGRLAVSAGKVPLWVISGPNISDDRRVALEKLGAQIFRTRTSGNGIDLVAVMQLLGDRGITRLMIEGGPRIAASFLKADLIDEAALLRSRELIGVDGLEAIDGLPLEALTKSPRLKSCGVEALGRDSIEMFERT